MELTHELLVAKVKEFADYSRQGRLWNQNEEDAYQRGVSAMEDKMLAWLAQVD